MNKHLNGTTYVQTTLFDLLWSRSRWFVVHLLLEWNRELTFWWTDELKLLNKLLYSYKHMAAALLWKWFCAYLSLVRYVKQHC